MNISFNRQQHTTQVSPMDNPRTQAISDGINKLLLQNIKIGDLFDVEIIDTLQKQIKVMLADGTIFEAQLDHSLDLNIGEQVSFQVKDIIGKQVLMEIAPQGAQGQQEGPQDGNAGINNILKQLNIPVTEDSQEAVKQLMQKMLPVTKDNVKQMEFGLKSSQLPLDSLLSMLENEIPITPGSLRQMEAYENGEIKLQGQLEAMIGNIVSSDDVEFLQETHKILSQAKEQIDPINPKVQEESKGAEELSKVSQEPKTLDLAQGKEVLEPNKQIIPKELDLSKEPLLNKELSVLKKEITELFKGTFFIDPTQLKDKSETKLQRINELYKEIYELTDKLKKLEEGQPEKEKAQIFTDVKSNIEFLSIANKYNTMLHIPLLIQDQLKHGELYIFNKKKKGKTGYHEASMLISLETVSLGTVETFIKKYNKQISVQFKTDSEEIENIIKHKIQLLKSNLKDKGYELISATYIPNTQPFLVKDESEVETNIERYRFDTKA